MPESESVETRNAVESTTDDNNVDGSFDGTSFDSSGRPSSPDSNLEEYGDDDEWDEEWLEEGSAEAEKSKKTAALTNPIGENFMDFAWKKPDKEMAQKHGLDGLWQRGERSFMKVGVHDFGEMSDGMELYFVVLKSFAIMFFVLSLLAMPLVVIANAGNNGLAIPDPAPPNSAQTLGNVGYNPSNPKASYYCRDQDGTNACVTTRWIYGLEVKAKYVTYVISGYEALSCIIMIAVSTWFVSKVEWLSKTIDDDTSTPSDFTVYVRNLPKDVSEGALLAHFSMRYALDYEQPQYPVLGLSPAGASLTLGFIIAIVFSAIAGGSVVGLFGALGSLATPFVLLLFTGMFSLVLWLCGFGKERVRWTPAQRWDENEEKRDWHRAEVQRRQESDQRKALADAQGLRNRTTQVGIAPLEESEEAPKPVELHPDLPGVRQGQVAPEEIYDPGHQQQQQQQPSSAQAEVDPESTATEVQTTDESHGGGGGGEEEKKPEPQEQKPLAEESAPPVEAPVPAAQTVDDSVEAGASAEASGSGGGGDVAVSVDSATPAGGNGGGDIDGGAPGEPQTDSRPGTANSNENWDGLNPGMPRPNPKPVDNCLHNGLPEVLGLWVADLHIVYPNGKIIALYLKQKVLMEKIETMREKVKQYKEDTEHNAGAKPKKEAKAHKALDKLMDKMAKTHKKVKSMVKDARKASDCEGCFITFHHEESQIRCLDDYRASNSWFGRYFQPKSLKFMWHSEDPNTGNKVQSFTSLRVEQASEPSDIFWQNLHVTDSERLVRIFFSNLITFTVLIISFAIALGSTTAGKAASEAISSTNYCDDFPAIWYGRYYNRTASDLWEKPVVWVRNRTIENDPDGPCQNDGRAYIVNQEFDMDWRNLPDFKPLPYNGYTENIPRPVRRLTPDYSAWLAASDAAAATAAANGASGSTFTAPDAGIYSSTTYTVDDDALTPLDGSQICDDVCHDWDPTKNYPNRTGCRTLSCFPGMKDWQSQAGYNCAEGDVYYPPSAVTNCYCKQVYLGFRPTVMGYQPFGASLPDNEVALCSVFEQSLNDASYFTYLSILMVVVINAISLPIIETCVAIEMRDSISQEKKALVSKMFSLQFVNTALITLLVNTAYSGTTPLGPLGSIGVGEGSYSDFSMEWYMNIGASLSSTMLMQIFTPHAANIAKGLVVGPLKRKFLSDSATTQRQLNELYEGVEFRIEERGAFVGVGLMVTLMYSTGVPALTVFAFFNFCASYAVDKFMLIKYYAQPPMYGPAVPKVLVNLMPMGTFLHMAFGLYMLSNKDLMWGPDLTAEAEEDAKEASSRSEILGLLLPRIVRLHTMFLFLLFCGYSVLFVLYLFGMLDEFVSSISRLQSRMYAACCGSRAMKLKAAAAALDHEAPPRPAFCNPFIARLSEGQKEYVAKHKKLSEEDLKRGFSLVNYDGTPSSKGGFVTKRYLEDTEVNGVFRPKGSVKFTWEHISDNTFYNYDIGRCDQRVYRTALLGLKASKVLPIPSRKMRIEEDAPEENPYAIGLASSGTSVEVAEQGQKSEVQDSEGSEQVGEMRNELEGVEPPLAQEDVAEEKEDNGEPQLEAEELQTSSQEAPGQTGSDEAAEDDSMEPVMAELEKEAKAAAEAEVTEHEKIEDDAAAVKRERQTAEAEAKASEDAEFARLKDEARQAAEQQAQEDALLAEAEKDAEDF